MHGVISPFVQKLNPSLSAEQAQTVALFISASMEGTTTFTGYEKPWSAQMPQMKTMAIKSFVHLAKTITPADIPELEKTIRRPEVADIRGSQQGPREILREGGRSPGISDMGDAAYFRIVCWRRWPACNPASTLSS